MRIYVLYIHGNVLFVPFMLNCPLLFLGNAHVLMCCMSYVRDSVCSARDEVSGLSLCYVWFLTVLCTGCIMCYVWALVCVVCRLQLQPSLLRSERVSLRSAGRARQRTAHDQCPSSKQSRNLHNYVLTYIYILFIHIYIYCTCHD